MPGVAWGENSSHKSEEVGLVLKLTASKTPGFVGGRQAAFTRSGQGADSPSARFSQSMHRFRDPLLEQHLPLVTWVGTSSTRVLKTLGFIAHFTLAKTPLRQPSWELVSD